MRIKKFGGDIIEEMKSGIRPVKTKGALRRFENLVATKPFQDAAQNLIDDPEELENA